MMTGPPLAAHRATRPREIVLIFSTAAWDGVRRRGYHTGDRLAEAILGDRSIERVLVVNPFRSAPRRAVRWALGDHGEPFPDAPGRRLVQPFRLRGSDPQRIAALERGYRAYGRRVAGAAARAGMRAPRVICLNPLVAGFADFGWADGLTFFAEDDLAAVESLAPWRSGIETAYRRMADRGVAVGAVSSAIVERIGSRGPSAVVPNGVEPAEWQALPSPPDWLASLPGPRILYLGVPDERLDAAAVRRIALGHPSASLVFVGGLSIPEPLADLFALPNVHFRPHEPRAAVPGIVAGADVCVVPHRVTPLTEAMSPLKIYEYLSAGRPVVATDMAPMRGIDPRVTLVAAGGDFAAGVRRGLELGPASEPERLRFISTHDWARRLDRILELTAAHGGAPQ